MKVTRHMTPVSEAQSRHRTDDLLHWIRDYCSRRINPRLIDERRSIPPYVALDFGRAGLFGLQVEEKYGGLALRHRDISRTLEQLAGIDMALGTWMLVCLYPGVRPIAAFGSSALKELVLPDLAAGRQLAGYAQTESGAGTHFAAMEARSVQGDDGIRRLTGSKVWIGNSSWASVLTVMAHDVAADGRRRGLTALAVGVDQPGVVLGREILSMGMRGMVQGEVSFRDVMVDPDHVVGRPGRGLDVGVDSMSYSRFAIAATCLGAMRRCARVMLRFADRRRIATGKLLDHPLTRATLSEVVVRISALESLLYAVADALDADQGVAAELFAACKVAGSEFAWQTADAMVQLLGSRGYDEANGLPQILRDVRVTRIFEGASEPLMAFLGAAAPNARSDLHEALREQLGAPMVAERLETAALELRARTEDPANEAGARAWQAAVAGEAALWATLLAAQPAGPRSPTAEWLEERFTSACEHARSGDPRERLQLSSSELESALSRLAEPIGDVEPALPGERLDLDPLLRR